MWRKPLEGGVGEQEGQCVLYFADRERSCVLVGVLTLLLAPSGGFLHTREKALHYCVDVQTKEQEVSISQKKWTFKSKIKG